MYIVDGKQITEEEFKNLQKDPNIKLVEITTNTYKTKQRLYS